MRTITCSECGAIYRVLKEAASDERFDTFNCCAGRLELRRATEAKVLAFDPNRRKQLRVSGHWLVDEGRVYASREFYRRMQTGRGRCSCGARSPLLNTDASRKRWHREHKEEVLQDQPAG